MPIQVTSGLIPMPILPAAQLPTLRVFATNYENQTHAAAVSVNRLEGATKVNIFYDQLEISGDDRIMIELDTELIQGQTIEVVATLPEGTFLPDARAVEASIAVVSVFIGDGSTSLLQYVSAGDFVPV